MDVLTWVVGALIALLYAHAACTALRANKGEREARTRVVCKAAAVADLALLKVASTSLRLISAFVNVLFWAVYTVFDVAHRAGLIPEAVNNLLHTVANATRSAIQNATVATDSMSSGILEASMQITQSQVNEECNMENTTNREIAETSSTGTSPGFPSLSSRSSKESSRSSPHRTLRARRATSDVVADVDYDVATDMTDVNPDAAPDITFDSLLSDSFTSPEIIPDRASITTEGSIEEKDEKEILKSRGEVARRRWTEWLRGYLRNLDQGLSLAERAGIFAVQRASTADGVMSHHQDADGVSHSEDTCYPLPPPCPESEDVSLTNTEMKTMTLRTPEIHSTTSRTLVNLETGTVAPGSPGFSGHPNESASLAPSQEPASPTTEVACHSPAATMPSSAVHSTRQESISSTYLKRRRSAPAIVATSLTTQPGKRQFPEMHPGPCQSPATTFGPSAPATQNFSEFSTSRRHAISPSVSVAIMAEASKANDAIPTLASDTRRIETSDRWREWTTEGVLAEDRRTTAQVSTHPDAKQCLPSTSAPPSASPYALLRTPSCVPSVPVADSTPVPVSTSVPVAAPVPVPATMPISTSVPITGTIPIPATVPISTSVPVSGSVPVSETVRGAGYEPVSGSVPASEPVPLSGSVLVSASVPVSSPVPVSIGPLGTLATPISMTITAPSCVQASELGQVTVPSTSSALPLTSITGAQPAFISPDVSFGSAPNPSPATTTSSSKPQRAAAPVTDDNRSSWLSWLQRSPEEVLARVRALEMRLERERGWKAGWGERGWNERSWNEQAGSWPAWGSPWGSWCPRPSSPSSQRCAGVQSFVNERLHHLQDVNPTRVADIFSQNLRPNVSVLGGNLLAGAGPYLHDPLQPPAQPGAQPEVLSQHASRSEEALIDEQAFMAPRNVHTPQWFQGARMPEESLYAPKERWGAVGRPSIAINDFQEEIYRRDVLKYASLQTKITTLQTPPSIHTYRVESFANRKTRDQLTGLSESNVRNIDTQTSESECTCIIPEMTQMAHLQPDTLITRSSLDRQYTGDSPREGWTPSEWISPSLSIPCPMCSSRRTQMYFRDRGVLSHIEGGETANTAYKMEKSTLSPTLSQSPLSSESTSPPTVSFSLGIGERSRRLKHKVARDVTSKEFEKLVPSSDITAPVPAPQAPPLTTPFASQGLLKAQVPVAPPAFVRARLAAQLGALVRQLREEVQRESAVPSAKRHQPSRSNRTTSPRPSSSSSSTPAHTIVALPSPTQLVWSNDAHHVAKTPWESPKEEGNTSKEETSPMPSSSQPSSTPSSRRSAAVQSKRVSLTLPCGEATPPPQPQPPAPAEGELARVPSGEELCFELAGLLRRLHSRSSRETTGGRTDDSLDSASTDSCEVPRKMRCVSTSSGHMIRRPVLRSHHRVRSPVIGSRGAGASTGGSAFAKHIAGQQAAEALLKQLRALDAACRRCEALRLSAVGGGQATPAGQTPNDTDAAKVLAVQVHELETSLETLSRRLGLLPDSRPTSSESKTRRILRPAPRQRSITIPSTYPSTNREQPCRTVCRLVHKCEKKPEPTFNHVAAQVSTSNNTLGAQPEFVAPGAVPTPFPTTQWGNVASQQQPAAATHPPSPARPSSSATRTPVAVKTPANSQHPVAPSLLTQQSRNKNETPPRIPSPHCKVSRPLSPMVGRDGPHSDRTTIPKVSIPVAQSYVSPASPVVHQSFRNGEEAHGNSSVAALVAHASSSSTTRRLRKHAGPIVVENLDLPMDSTH